MKTLTSLLILFMAALLPAREMMTRPEGDEFRLYEALKPVEKPGLYLRKGDRLAICGDSITEQKMYSRLIETYLTACVPELNITCRQFGWSGERAGGFAARMEEDVLIFKPTIATTCYGMNDHRYVPYTEEIGQEYIENQKEIIGRFRADGIRVVVGSPGTIGKMPSWVKTATGTVEDLNLSLLRLRNHNVELAEEMEVRFADVYWPMLTASIQAKRQYGEGFMIPGQDGVHPGWAGQTVMAYAFLVAMGLEGSVGTLTMNAADGSVLGSVGHEILEAEGGRMKIKSTRYPFCVPEGDPSKDDSIQAAMKLIPFHERLNRFMLYVTGGTAAKYEIRWGETAKTFDRAALEAGVNLAAEFQKNPFSGPFENVSKAVFAKQDYETRQIKTLFHGPEARADKAMTVTLTEKTRAPLAAAVIDAVVPVEHVLEVKPLP